MDEQPADKDRIAELEARIDALTDEVQRLDDDDVLLDGQIGELQEAVEGLGACRQFSNPDWTGDKEARKPLLEQEFFMPKSETPGEPVQWTSGYGLPVAMNLSIYPFTELRRDLKVTVTVEEVGDEAKVDSHKPTTVVVPPSVKVAYDEAVSPPAGWFGFVWNAQREWQDYFEAQGLNGDAKLGFFPDEPDKESRTTDLVFDGNPVVRFQEQPEPEDCTDAESAVKAQILAELNKPLK